MTKMSIQDKHTACYGSATRTNGDNVIECLVCGKWIHDCDDCIYHLSDDEQQELDDQEDYT